MMNTSDINKMSQARLQDAKALFESGRFDGAAYLCGYAVELRLKYRISKVLDWKKYPPNKDDHYRRLKTHDFNILLSFTGKEKIIKTNYLAEWSMVSQWGSDWRYNPTGSVDQSLVNEMIRATKKLLRAI